MMNPEPKNMNKLSSEPEAVVDIRCDCCQRHLASASDWIRGERLTICETCYRHFLNPGHNCPPREIG